MDFYSQRPLGDLLNLSLPSKLKHLRLIVQCGLYMHTFVSFLKFSWCGLYTGAPYSPEITLHWLGCEPVPPCTKQRLVSSDMCSSDMGFVNLFSLSHSFPSYLGHHRQIHLCRSESGNGTGTILARRNKWCLFVLMSCFFVSSGLKVLSPGDGFQPWGFHRGHFDLILIFFLKRYPKS